MQVTSRSQSTRVTQCSVVNTANRIPFLDFNAWAKYHLGLPQATPWRQDVDKTNGDDLAVCMLHEEDDCKFLDPNGDHAVACPSTFRARSYTHSRLNQVIAKYCKEAELYTQLEPPTEQVLRYEYDKKECSLLFHRTPSALTLEKSQALFVLYQFEMQDPQTNPARRALLAKGADLLIRQIPTDATGLRLDVFASAKPTALGHLS